MSGYLDRRDPDVPPMTRERWLAAVGALAAAGAMLFICEYASRFTGGILGTIGRVPPSAPLFFSAGAALMLIREAAADGPQPVRMPWRNRRLLAVLFYSVGILLIAASLILK